MSDGPRSDVVARQYERWCYPQPIEDLDAWLVHNWQWFDPAHAQCVLWPERAARPELDILIAGCGTNQAAVFAYDNPQARVLAVDVSRHSLDHEQHLKDKYALGNLELRQLPIEQLPALGRDFDLIVSTGVLHHLADPQAGMDTLARCMRPDGVAAIMLYAKYGRVGVEWLQSLFRDLGLRQDDASVAMVRDALQLLPEGHPARTYLQLENNLASDAVLVDTFLHGRERSYDVAGCQQLVSASGLAFQGWFFKAPYYPHDLSNALLRAIDALPEPAMWAAMERVNTRNACHFFMACHPEQAAARAIDFESPACLDRVPVFRMRCGVEGDAVFRPGWRKPLDARQLALVRRVDGRRTLREIAAADPDAASRDAFARELFASLWWLDFIAPTLPAAG